MVALRAARDTLALNAEVLDALNVFPVPDGDTGRNMLHTVRPAVDRLDERRPESLRELADRLGDGLTNSGRGNSGFLLSAFFNAFLDALAERRTVDPASFTEAFSAGEDAARRALASPREGTLLTASGDMALAMRASEAGELDALLADAVAAGYDAVSSTPELLPLLRRAGVIDAGALGLVVIFEGMLAALRGTPLPRLREADFRFEPRAILHDHEPDPWLLPFCTQLLIDKHDDRALESLRAWLDQHCDSVVLQERGERVKLHVHSRDPDEVEREARRVGSVVERRIEDMREQMSALASSRGVGEEAVPAVVLALAPGAGWSSYFGELGVSATLEYDRDLPSVEELVAAISAVDAPADAPVIVLANDGNIAPAAGRAAELSGNRSVEVIATRNPVEGVAALYGFDPTGSTNRIYRACARRARWPKVWRCIAAFASSPSGRWRSKRGRSSCSAVTMWSAPGRRCQTRSKAPPCAWKLGATAP